MKQVHVPLVYKRCFDFNKVVNESKPNVKASSRAGKETIGGLCSRTQTPLWFCIREEILYASLTICWGYALCEGSPDWLNDPPLVLDHQALLENDTKLARLSFIS